MRYTMTPIDLPRTYHLEGITPDELTPAIGSVGTFTVHIVGEEVVVVDPNVRVYAGQHRVVMTIGTYYCYRGGVRYRVMNYTRADRRYRGTGIASRVYEVVATKAGPIMSGSAQSPGGQAVWNSLIKRGKVFAAALWKGTHYSVNYNEWGQADCDDFDLYNNSARLVAV